MNQTELTRYNICQNLDDLMNLDPRGYGVCRILYSASRKYTGKPLTLNAAETLDKTVKDGDIVYIITGFVLLPHKKAEMDGIIGAMFLARALVKAFNAKPVIICPEENIAAVEGLSYIMGLHLFKSVPELLQYPVSMAVIPFTKDAGAAAEEAQILMDTALPKAVISIEAPGANKRGVYHNATGLDVTEIEAKADVLFEKLREAGVTDIAIGDLGNEIGMGTIGEHLDKYIPYAREGACRCGCGGGIAAKSCASVILTATTSDWGAYGLIAAIAHIKGDLSIMHNAEMERQAIYCASRNGMIDMYGWLIPAIDGFDEKININIVDLMNECISYAPKLVNTCKTWFEKVEELGFFDSENNV